LFLLWILSIYIKTKEIEEPETGLGADATAGTVGGVTGPTGPTGDVGTTGALGG